MEDYNDIPEEFKRQMYDSYCNNMKFYGKEEEIEPYEVWLDSVINTEIQ